MNFYYPYTSLNNGIVYIDSKLQKRNILIKHNKIIGISSNPYSIGYTINCKNLWILPGMIDSHVHLRNPGHSYKETWDSGTKAALKGGITCILDMPNTYPPTIDIKSLKIKMNTAKKESRVNYGFFIGATKENIPHILSFQELYIGIKIYFGPTTGNLFLNNISKIRFLLKNSLVPIAFHAEIAKDIIQNEAKYQSNNLPLLIKHNKIRSIFIAKKAIQKIIQILPSIFYSCPIIFCHISSIEELNLIEKAKTIYSNIYSETCPHYLFLNYNDVPDSIQQYLKVNPPIRNKKDQKDLYKAFMEDKIDIFSTDHAPHKIWEKETLIYSKNPSGIPGLETSLPLLLSEMNQYSISLSQIIKKMVYNPIQLFSIQNKGFILPFYDADLTIISPYEKYIFSSDEIQTNAKWNPFIGNTFYGKVIGTIINGKIGYWKNQFFKSIGKSIL